MKLEWKPDPYWPLGNRWVLLVNGDQVGRVVYTEYGGVVGSFWGARNWVEYQFTTFRAAAFAVTGMAYANYQANKARAARFRKRTTKTKARASTRGL